MSRINIQGTIDNIKSKSNVYTPIIEAVVNSIDSISKSGVENGKIEIKLIRDTQLELDDSKPFIKGVIVRDNGEGFNSVNRESFDTFYSQEKKEIGGKGFGRFMFVKYFKNVNVDSVYKDAGNFKKRTFKFGRKFEIIEDEKITVSDTLDTYAEVSLLNLNDQKSFDKNIETISRKLLDKLLIFFLRDDFKCPTIIVKDDDGTSIILNDYLTAKNEIQLIGDKKFVLGEKTDNSQTFNVKIFKMYFAGNQKSKIILTANNRAVTETNLHKYIPEFEDDFFDKSESNEKTVTKNYIIRTYVIGKYLDSSVSLERETFDFDKEKSTIYNPYSQKQIEQQTAIVTKGLFDVEVSSRIEKKVKRIRNYVSEQAPWHKSYFSELDLSNIPYSINESEIEAELQKIKFKKEQFTKSELQRLLSENGEENQDKISEAISTISEIGKSDLAHYVFNRKLVLDAMTNLLKRREDGKGELEKDIHHLIYPMGKDSETLDYRDHNLWLLDERLVFSEYVASDKKIGTKKDALKEPDLVIFDKKNSFRNGDNEFSNPLTIFEFKRPKRTAYSEDDDPVMQIGKYLKDIRDGKYEMPEGLEPIKVNDHTPVYGYVVCTINDKIREFAEKHQLTVSPDNDSYFGYHRGYKMYIEIVGFNKLLKDATLRNKIFFKKLRLE
ncbi:ATP-binding protein [Winogradskyella sp. SYSU M77433]|uniref:ATP-binding protein n=1 Tax=Winogradskyella sp. SYSU M77433 TaxID=3042722 RepID=UPI0024819288|nr:ATP-binding protein [Winogradskyella sp. SYSU M77433]MDH7913476.1 ATP-binding protein [Winogradskyella sp. SYSU M77433]